MTVTKQEEPLHTYMCSSSVNLRFQCGCGHLILINRQRDHQVMTFNLCCFVDSGSRLTRASHETWLLTENFRVSQSVMFSPVVSLPADPHNRFVWQTSNGTLFPRREILNRFRNFRFSAEFEYHSTSCYSFKELLQKAFCVQKLIMIFCMIMFSLKADLV